MPSRMFIMKLCVMFHVLEVAFGITLATFSFLLQKTADVGLKYAPSWTGIPFALLGLVGVIVIVMNKYKEELVFVLVFHGLVIVLCSISLVLTAPGVSRWKDVDIYLKSGMCSQFNSNCNCTQSLPSKVYECSDLENVYSLALMIALFSAFCLLIACISGYLDFYVIKKFAALKDTTSLESFSTRKEPSENGLIEEGQEFEDVGHIGPLSTPDVLPKHEVQITPRTNSLDSNKSEAELQWQESPREERQSVVSTASLPMGNGVSRPRMKSDSFRDRAATMPNSVGASKNSIRSRKDSLLKRLNSGQSRDDEEQDNNDKNEELVLNAIQDGSRASFRRMSATPTRSESRRLSLPGQQSPRPDLQETNGNEAFSRRKSLRGSQRGSSLDNEIVEDAEESENTAEKSSQETGRIRKTPILTSLINEVDTFSLPPLPLKGTQAGLSVTERTFSAPMLPFTIEPDGLPVPNLTQRPGSSGSQVVARSKKKSSLQVRNELIDKEMLDNDDYIIRGRERADTNERFAKHRGSVLDNGSFFRKNSYDTNSTNVGPIPDDDDDDDDIVPADEAVDDDDNSTESNDDLNKKPRWHPPWQLKQEIVAHRDSVPILAIEPKNRWFASGSSDRSMKIWDINTGACRLTVRDHKAGIRALTFGITGHRFLFSAGDDRQLLCTDIEVNRVIHKYPDQNSVIYAMTMYAPSELLVTCGRDKHVKIWDTREKKCVKTMRGHINSVSSLAILENSRQIISGSHDSTMRIWDIGEGRCTQILMGHEKSVRSIVVHPEEPIISSASTERVIHWKMPDGEKKQEITSKDISINCISVNPQGALVAAGSNGVIHLWDWRTGHKFQKIHRTKVYQSQEVPICVFCVAFDKTGSRLIVSDASNVVKVYREAYTRVRRRQNTGDTVKTVQKKRSLFSKYSTSDYAYT